MAWNCFPCFNPTVTDDETNTGPSTSHTGPSTPHAAGPSSSRAAAPSTSRTGPSTPRAAGTFGNFLSYFKPTATNDDTNAGPSTSTATPSAPHASGPSTPRGPGPGYDQLAKDKKNLNLNFEVGASSQSHHTQDILSFGFLELQVATANFSTECLGEGGFGKVYKGYLFKEKKPAAIKKLNLEGSQGIHEFVVEAEVLRKADHPNIVELLGFCAEKKQRLLVYEYMALGSLDRHLFDPPLDRPPLDWKTRFQIAVDVASGLEYLHDKMIPNIIHLDVKSSNILLDVGYHAKLSDFGTARVSPTGDETRVSTMIYGSSAYVAPKYHETGQLTHKSDIYSFGVILLELITGRSANERPFGEQNTVEWVRFLFIIKDMRRLEQLADPRLEGQHNKASLKGALDLAIRCVNLQALERPVIAEVVQALNECRPPILDS